MGGCCEGGCMERVGVRRGMDVVEEMVRVEMISCGIDNCVLWVFSSDQDASTLKLLGAPL